MTVALILGLVALALFVLWWVLTYNGFVKRRNRVDEAFSDIDTQLRRRHDLIPNLIETVKGYAAHEQGTFEAVNRARSGAIEAHGPKQQAQAEQALGGALGKLMAVAEAYPDLKANGNFLALQNELTDTEDKIQASRRFYNMQVRDLNTKIESVPSNVIAKGRFEKRAFFELDDESQRSTPQVAF